jgi:hypothetical protein
VVTKITSDDSSSDYYEERGKKAKTRHAIGQTEVEFHGHSSEAGFLERMRDKLGDGIDISRASLDKADKRSLPGPRLFDFTTSPASLASLPSKERAQELVDIALDAFPFLCVIHRPNFDYRLNLIYALKPEDYDAAGARFLPLLYSIMALGSLFADIDKEGCSREQSTAQG